MNKNKIIFFIVSVFSLPHVTKAMVPGGRAFGRVASNGFIVGQLAKNKKNPANFLDQRALYRVRKTKFLIKYPYNWSYISSGRQPFNIESFIAGCVSGCLFSYGLIKYSDK